MEATAEVSIQTKNTTSQPNSLGKKVRNLASSVIAAFKITPSSDPLPKSSLEELNNTPPGWYNNSDYKPLPPTSSDPKK